MMPFVGVDGEGGDVAGPDGFTHHRYTMLRAGEQWTPAPTGEEDRSYWIRFLAGLPKKRIHVAYFFDYDVTMMLRDLPEQALICLNDMGEVAWGGYRIGYRPRKEFYVRHAGKQTTINDVGTFFQCKFSSALRRWNVGSSEQLDIIETGKEGRQHFAELTDETVAYNKMECELLAELMTKFRRTCEVIGYLPAHWQGPGQLAKAMFRKHGLPKTEQLPEVPPGVWEIAQAAYYGGRFETSATGPVKGSVDGWDINSAYPYACTLLPCLLHGQWIPCKRVCPGSTGIYSVSFRHRKELLWYGLPVRQSNGSIRFPRSGAGWYHTVEIESAARLGADYRVHSGWEYISDCDCRPFDFMYRLYSVRQGVGKTEAGHALKLAMNSAYGIIAQAIGRAPYANPFWAGLITAITRARLNDALSHDPYAVVMLATDGLFCHANALPLQPSPDLGGWDRKVYDDGMHIVMPGIYFVGGDDVKTRGIPATAVLREQDAIIAAWQGSPSNGIDVDLRQFVGLRLALARNSLHTMGEWLPTTKWVGYDWSTKRRPHAARRCPDGLRTLPYEGNGEWTIPYDRYIGGNLIRNLDRLEFADTPDWAETLTEVL